MFLLHFIFDGDICIPVCRFEVHGNNFELKSPNFKTYVNEKLPELLKYQINNGNQVKNLEDIINRQIASQKNPIDLKGLVSLDVDDLKNKYFN